MPFKVGKKGLILTSLKNAHFLKDMVEIITILHESGTKDHIFDVPFEFKFIKRDSGLKCLYALT
jgi:hypothetical protein